MFIKQIPLREGIDKVGQQKEGESFKKKFTNNKKIVSTGCA
jgi:hypothetical protein